MDAKALLAVLAAAVAGAVAIPLDRPGIGWAIAGAAVLALLRRRLGLVAALLLGIGAVRSAGWMFALCVTAAIVLIAVTIVDGRSWREVGFALPRWVWGGWWGFRSAAATTDRHGAVRLARGIGIGMILVVVFGVLLGSADPRFADVLRPLLSWTRLVTFATVALLFLGALHFKSRTAAAHGDTARSAETALPGTAAERGEAVPAGKALPSDPGIPTGQAAQSGPGVRGPAGPEVHTWPGVQGPAGPVVQTGPVAVAQPEGTAQAGGLAGGAAGWFGSSGNVGGDVGGAGRTGETGQPRGVGHAVAAAAKRRSRPARRRWGRLEWAVPVALVDLLFAAFAIVQFSALFGGDEHVLDPRGPTYAQYAWAGFLQLASVAVLTLGVVAVVLSRLAPADARVARALVGALCGLTLVIVGSALWRMQLYVKAFGFTRARLLAAVLIVWLGLILLLLLAVWRRAILPRLTLATGALLLLGLAVANPDWIVARTVIGRWEKDGHLDAPYLASLSLDALPALERLPDPKRSCIAAAIIRRNLDRGIAWNEWNAARLNASGLRLREENCEYYLSVGYRMEGNWTDPSQLR